MEQHWIDTLTPEYNILRVAGSTYGYRFTPAQKLSAAETRGLVVEYQGERTTLSEIAARTGMPIQRLWRRVVKQGLSIEVALSRTLSEVHTMRVRKQHAERSPEMKALIADKLRAAHTGVPCEARHVKVVVGGKTVSLRSIALDVGCL